TAALRHVDITMFHMTDFEADRGEFHGWKENRAADRTWLLNELLRLIIDNVPSWVGFVSRPEGATEKFKAVYKRGIVDSMTLLAREAGKSDDEALALVYASHPEYPRATIEKHFGDIGMYDPRLRTCAILAPLDAPPLQAADLVAYELSRAQRADGPIRYPLKRLKAGLRRLTLEERFAGPEAYA
ncbi:MAG TPA: hypothetical protein VFW75_14100, partial [Acetobacteraceae bacterium]|nr:hypothetical protein [Acetobacteraceae bacterium]